MFFLIGILTSIIIPLLYYRYILGKNSGVESKKYITAALLSATLYVIPIIILEIAWDKIFMPGGTKTLVQELISAFFRAALLEEAVKFFWSYRLVKKNRALDIKECILLAGIVGIGYGFTEKFVMGSALGMVINGIVPGHMLFQWIMGYYLYKAFSGMSAEGGKPNSGYLVKAFVVPFILHGIWDGSLGLIYSLFDKGDTMTAIGACLVIIFVIITIVLTIKAAKKIKRLS